MTAADFLREYERCTNSHQFNEVAPLIADDALFLFSEGSFQGKKEIKQAFERTWAYIQDEHYAIEQVQWLANDEQLAICCYVFRWQGRVEGQVRQGSGRGTSVLRKVGEQWQVIHEHLSQLPG